MHMPLDIFILTDAGLLFQDGIWAFEYTLYGCRVICFDRDECLASSTDAVGGAGKDTMNGLRGCLTNVSVAELPDIFLWIVWMERALKPVGILYVFFKYGQFERFRRKDLFGFKYLTEYPYRFYLLEKAGILSPPLVRTPNIQGYCFYKQEDVIYHI